MSAQDIPGRSGAGGECEVGELRRYENKYNCKQVSLHLRFYGSLWFGSGRSRPAAAMREMQ